MPTMPLLQTFYLKVSLTILMLSYHIFFKHSEGNPSNTGAFPTFISCHELYQYCTFIQLSQHSYLSILYICICSLSSSTYSTISKHSTHLFLTSSQYFTFTSFTSSPFKFNICSPLLTCCTSLKKTFLFP